MFEVIDQFLFLQEASNSSTEIVCKYCNIKLSLEKGKKPFDRINEHTDSTRHKRLKQENISSTNHQPSLEELLVRQKELEANQKGVIYDFINSICLCGLSMYVSDGPIGKRINLLFELLFNCVIEFIVFSRRFCQKVHPQHKNNACSKNTCVKLFAENV